MIPDTPATIRQTWTEIDRFRFDLYKHTRCFQEGPYQEVPEAGHDRIAFGVLLDGRQVFCYPEHPLPPLERPEPPKPTKPKRLPRHQGIKSDKYEPPEE